MSKKCDVCGANLGLLSTVKISNGNICFSCSNLSASYNTETVENMKKYWNSNRNRISKFSETQLLKNLGSEIVHIDNNNNLFYIGKSINPIIYSFSEILNYGYDITELNTTTKKKGGITRAVVGGMVAGPVGAVVGSSTAKSKSITSSNKLFYFNVYIYSSTKKVIMSFPPQGFKEFLDKCILENSSKNIDNSSSNSIIDKIKSLSELKEQSIISQQEFEQKKQELLSRL